MSLVRAFSVVRAKLAEALEIADELRIVARELVSQQTLVERLPLAQGVLLVADEREPAQHY